MEHRVKQYHTRQVKTTCKRIVCVQVQFACHESQYIKCMMGNNRKCFCNKYLTIGNKS
jgi:hypothetical protein